ncbi:MAG: dodecin domain-containing protein [Myxococcales bacterium]|nr:dodecin domain-containing protein [Myxococcales bacterium]
MSVAKITEISSESSKSFEDAMRVGIERASKTIQNIEGAWLKDQQLLIKNGTVTAFRVTMKLTFVLKE